MDPRWRETFQLWAETEEFHKHISDAKNEIELAYQRFSRPYVAFSGGKDSSVMLHLVLQRDPKVLVFHWDYGPYYMPREFARAILENARKIGARNIRVETSRLYLKLREKAVNVIGRVLIGQLGPQLRREGYDACFLGLRAEEGSKRKARTKLGWTYRGEHVGPSEVYPIRGLTWKDVWSYIIKENLPYLAIYDKYARLLGYDQVRLVTFFDMEFEKFGSPYLDGFLQPDKRYQKL